MGTWTELLKMGGKVGGKILESGKAAAPHVWQAAKIAYPHAKDAVKTTAHIARTQLSLLQNIKQPLLLELLLYYRNLVIRKVF